MRKTIQLFFASILAITCISLTTVKQSIDIQAEATDEAPEKISGKMIQSTNTAPCSQIL